MAEQFPVLTEISEQVKAYIDAGQKWFNTPQKPANAQDEAAAQQAREAEFMPKPGFAPPVQAPAMSRNYDPFPDVAPPEEMAESMGAVDFPDDWK